MKYLFYLSCCSMLFLWACHPEPPEAPVGAFQDGLLISNEGVYGQSSGTVTFYHPDSAAPQQQIFQGQNKRELGNVLQSMAFEGDEVFLVVNNSNKIEVANANTFESIAQITNLRQPRYCQIVDTNTAYVSEWGLDLLSGSVAVIDLNDYSLIQRIELGIGKGPERMLLHEGYVYLTHTGGLDTENFVAVINTQSHQVVDTIVVRDHPNSLQISNNGVLWVACAGKTVYSTYPEIDTNASTLGALVGINLQNNTVSTEVLLEKGRGAAMLVANQQADQLFFYHNKQICSFNPNNLSWAPICTGDFYGLGFDKENNYLYAADYAGIQPAWIYQIRSSDGAKIDSFLAGVFANNFYFR